MSDFGPPPQGPPSSPPPAGDPYDPEGQRPRPAYPPPATSPQAHGSTPSPFTGLGAKLGERILRRPEPRLGVSLSGAGAALVLLGLVVWAGTYWGDGLNSSGDSGLPDTNRNLFGALLFAIATAIGYVLVIRQRTGPLATAGAVASAIGVPATLAFLTLDLTNLSSGFPINLDLVYWVSLIVWLGTYLFVPGARGRSVYLFLIAYYLYGYVLFKSVNGDVGVRISSTVNGSSGPHFSGFGTISAVSLIFGLGYYAIAFALDRAGKHGAATGLMFPAFFVIALGIGTLEPNTSLAADGVILIIIASALCWYAGRFGRRLTCWAWAIGVVVGVFLIVADASPDNGTAAGITFLIVGLIVIAVATLAARALNEPDDMDLAAAVRSR